MKNKVTFVVGGMEIHNPFLSSCGRFIVEPTVEYGFYEVNNGGNSKALRKDLEDGQYILITSADGMHIPKTWEDARIALFDKFSITLMPYHSISFSADGDEPEISDIHTKITSMSQNDIDNVIKGAVEDALNAGCLHIQLAIGQTTGDIAGQFFSGTGEEELVKLMSSRFKEYFETERMYALPDSTEGD